MTTSQGTERDDRATLAAVAELVVRLSLAERSVLTYGGPGHPAAEKALDRAAEALAAALDLQDEIALHFTHDAVFCGGHCLRRNHPVYRKLAETLWSLGIAGLVFRRGAGESDLRALIALLTRAEKEQATREQAEELLASADLQAIEIELLRDVVQFSVATEISVQSQLEQRRRWEEFIRRLGQEVAPTLSADELLGSEVTEPEVAGDYASAMIDYLKELHEEERHEMLLASSAFGRRIKNFLDSAGPHLRHQLMSGALVARELGPDSLKHLVELAGQDALLEGLQRLNDAGKRIPLTTFRTLSALSLSDFASVDVKVEVSEQAAESPASSPAASDVEALFEAGDEEYTSPEYQGRLDRLVEENRSGLATNRLVELPRLEIPPVEAEEHFLKVASDLLRESPDLAGVLTREVQVAYQTFLDLGDVVACRESMRLARNGRRLAPKDEPFVWETAEVLDHLVDRLVTGDRETSLEAGLLLVSVGLPAVPILLRVLTETVEPSIRRRALDALANLVVDPGPLLLEKLEDADLPEQLGRNILYVLRRRGDPVAAGRAVALWPQAQPRFKIEIVRYLCALDRPEAIDLVRDAFGSAPIEILPAVTLAALQSRHDGAIAAIVDWARALPRLELGSPLHVEVLRRLGRSDHPSARAYVTDLASEPRALLPWRRKALADELDRLGVS